MASKPREVGQLTTAFVAELRAQRGRVGWSRAKLARESGVPLPTLRSIENGTAAIDLQQMEKLASAMGTTITALMGPAEDEYHSADAG